ncbi:hypothetical protein PHJA_000570000 [Phtheirospermum japonicum]|uniref:Transmembrane protein 45A n=1 Tax=Phtheirospermum japonicum TaxID=374723 RepID=A0A830BJQ8_9LAMI|nr:hypothetical protein PHJA_000570000 [Phtheirospermum japonicum]
MGGTSGHVSLGLAFLIIGLWHLFNSIKLHSLHPKSYATQPWHPVSKFRHFEPITIMLVTTAFISSELFIGRQEPISPDGSIPSKNLPHLEHSVIALSFFVYALFCLLFDKININSPSPSRNGLVHLVQAVAFGQQLLILHLHSTDKMGVEGQYHWLLQIVTFMSLITTILAIRYPECFVNSFVRAFSVVLQGVWLIVMGVMLWTPGLMPKGCFLKPETGRVVVLCHDDRALDRAKALVNIQFSLYLTVLTVFSMSLYVIMIMYYPREKVEYTPITKIQEQDEGDCNFGAQMRTKS